MINNMFIIILILIIYFSYIFFNFLRFFVLLLISFFCLFFTKNQHLTIILVQLEILGLISLFSFSNYNLFLEKDMIILFIIMVVVVIEASVGLRLIVKQARNINKEFFKYYF